VVQNLVKYLMGQGQTEQEAQEVTSPIQVLLEILSGVPVESILSEMGTVLQEVMSEGGITPLSSDIPTSSTGTGSAGGGGSVLPPSRKTEKQTPEDDMSAAIAKIVGTSTTTPTMSSTVPKTSKTTVTSPSKSSDIKSTFRVSSAPTLDIASVRDNFIIPNMAFHIASSLAIGLVQIIAELMSVGQIDKILEPLMTMLDLTDASSIFQGVRQIRLQNQVLTPYKYFVNDNNPQQIPPYSDLIRLRVREDQEGKPLLTQDEFIQQMKYIGYAEFWSNALWEAHYTFPSNRELFTMYNIGLITQDELRKQLVLNDIAPRWVDNIMAIAKRYPTMPELRMIARRMDIPTELVEKGLSAQGIREEYFPYYVTMFKDWDVDNIRGRQQTALLKTFTSGILNDEELRTALTTTGASENEIEELVKEGQWKRYTRRLMERKNTILALFKKKIISREDAELSLVKLGFEAVDIDHWLDYVIATLGLVPEIEYPESEELEGVESEETAITRFEDWQDIERPIVLAPSKLPSEEIEPPPEEEEFH